MRITLERLRIGLLVGAGLLVLMIAGFFGYARYRVHRALVNLPGRMGATITKEFDGYTWSQSDGKRTTATLHAAKAVEHKDGKLTLHDVSMVLYGKKGDRADRISGDEFEYDTRDEIVRAVGIVHLDLQAPVAEGTRTSEAAKHLDPHSAQEDAGFGSRVIHVKTSGLVYMKKLGVAATKEGIEFAFGGFTGHAVGAEYDSDSGHVVLQSALTMSGLDKGKPIAMTAAHGELDREQNVAEFTDAHYSSAGETAQAETAKIHLRSDGTMERIEGERRVMLEGEGQGSVTSNHADLALDTANKPKTAVLVGNVHFTDDEPLRQAHGDSDRANIEFDGQGHIQHALLQGAVRTTESLRGGAGEAAGASSRRDLTADSLELSLVVEGKPGKPQLRDVRATGSARLSSLAPDAKGGGTTRTKMAADSLEAHLVARSGFAELSTLHGVGHTAVQQATVQGVDQESFGDMLDANFRESAKGKGAVELATAVQQGNVVMNRSVPAKKTANASSSVGSTPDVQHATAAKAAFDADSDRLTLTGDLKTGDVRMRDAQSEIAAARLVLEQDSGDATADGAVKVSYFQAASGARTAEPVHVLAARAELNHDAGRATFYGRPASGPTALARMWQAGTDGQGGSQIEAPVLVFEQVQKRLTARPETAGTPDTVHVVLAGASSAKDSDGNGTSAAIPAKAGSKTKKDASKPPRQGVTRIVSSLMVYSDLLRQAELSGGVRVLNGDGEMQSQQATAFLIPSGSGKTSGSGDTKPAGVANNPGSSLTGLFGGSLEKIVATQHIEITQPGRKATGERLIYTASDQMFVLTGTAASPPKVDDRTQGTTTGAMLRFHSGDDSVVVSGNDADAPARKVHTETRVKQ